MEQERIRDELDAMGIDVMQPEGKRETTFADALDLFSSFVLHEEQKRCEAIIERHMGDSAGHLQGGTDDHEIYRVMITDDKDDAAEQLFQEFRASVPGKYANVLTVERLEQYMLGMCERRSTTRHCKKYRKLDNLMFILAFGPTHGQVRHIDNMDPNLQICLYMSEECPSTIIYDMDGPSIADGNELVDYWEEEMGLVVPDLAKGILQTEGDVALGGKSHTKYFSFWDSIDSTLRNFGKLYRPVSLQLSLQTDPGTALLVSGNEVHAGPPTVGPRMFAFAIGVPEERTDDEDEDGEDERYKNESNEGVSEHNSSSSGGDNGEDNNGEVQYSPALLHVDLCCILFSIMEYEYPDRQAEHQEAKQFLLDLLVTLLKTIVDEYPKETYSRLLGDDRSEVRDWLGKAVEAISLGGHASTKVQMLMQEAIESESMFYSPCVGKKPKKKRRTRNKKKKV